MSEVEASATEKLRAYARSALLQAELQLMSVVAPTGAPTTEYAFWLWRAVQLRPEWAHLAELARDAGCWWTSAFNDVALDEWKERYAAWLARDSQKRG